MLNAWSATRLIRCYGTDVWNILSKNADENGIHFGKGFTQAEVEWLIHHEFAYHTDDILWRRTNMGLDLTKKQINAVQKFVTSYTDRNPFYKKRERP